MIDVLVAPAATWQPTKIIVRPASAPSVQTAPSWHDHAFQENWPQAVMTYLSAHGNKPQKLWRVINDVGAESLAEDRWELRENKRQILKSIHQLRRQGTLLRYRREWIASLMVDRELVPMEQLKGMRIART
jgi:hypothetical protein